MGSEIHHQGALAKSVVTSGNELDVVVVKGSGNLATSASKPDGVMVKVLLIRLTPV